MNIKYKGTIIQAKDIPKKILGRTKLILSVLIERYRADRRFVKMRAKHTPVRVAFIVQMPEIWNKERLIFEKMQKDERFDPKLIVVPAYDFTRGNINKEYSKELKYFQKSYDKSVILTNKDLGDDFSELRKCNFDYVFFQRCYEMYLPNVLHTKNVSEYAKTCYVPYCFHLTQESSWYYRTSFFNYMYITFCSNQGQMSRMKKLGLTKSIFLGYPSLESISKNEKMISDNLVVLWTPRWTIIDEFGGSSFYKFKDNVLSIVSQNDFKLIIRPHPMMFENAIKENVMSSEEVANYIDECSARGIEFDRNENIDDTLSDIDILMTDFSSIIPNAFLSGLPIIYLQPHLDIETYSPFTEMMSQLYFADNLEKIVQMINAIGNGNDYKKESRDKLIEKIQRDNQGSTSRILDCLINDQKGEK